MKFAVARCAECGLVCLNPRPGDLLPYYDVFHESEKPEKDYFIFLRPDRLKIARKTGAPGRVLDIGCGTGEFLLEMARAGWEPHGCDIYRGACERARKSGLANVHNGDILTLDLPEKSFDLITLWHVLEHLEHPSPALKKIASLLKDEGTLVIESPDFASLQARSFKDKWFALELPRHLYHFEPGTLEKMLAAAGLQVTGKDRFVNPRVAFISLKNSVFRAFGYEKPPLPPGSSGGAQGASPRKERHAFWWLLRGAVNLAFLGASLVLVATGQEDSFRVYCRKAGTGG